MPGELEFRSGEEVTVTIGESQSSATVVDPPNAGGWEESESPLDMSS